MMRLFYDRYTTRSRAELTLVAADMLALVAVVLYLTRAFLGDAHATDKILLVVWAVTPRALARILSGLEHPTEFVKVLSAAAIAVVLIVALLGTGWDLIHSVSPPGHAPTPLGLGMLLCAWGAGFLVCQPGAYRLFDFFLGGAILVGLKDGAPQPYIWIPVFFLAICLSSVVRHLLHDVFYDRRSPPINLQNARAVAFLGTGATTLAFLAICLTLGGGRFPPPTPRLDDQGNRFTLARFPGDRGDSRDQFRDRARGRGDAPADDLSRTVDGRTDWRDEAGEAPRRIGFTQHVRLRDLTRPEMDSAVVLRIRARSDTSTGRQWRPLESVLWKGITLATYDTRTQGWKQPTMTEEAPWPTRLAREVPVGLENGEAVTLVHVVVNPVFQNFVTPYFTSEIRTEDANGAVIRYVRSLPGDDIFPRPGFLPYSRYLTRTVLANPNQLPDIPFTRRGREEKIDPRYLEIPAAADLGVDLRDVAGLIFKRETKTSVRARLESLRRYFQAGFEYSNDEDWRGGGAPLREFLLRHRRGDCTYFATAAALLLRAADLPTRFVAGFSGGEWEPATHEVVVRNGRAHGWAEVHVQGAGWFPVDATLWVAPSKDTVVADRILFEEEDEADSGDDVLEIDDGQDAASADQDRLIARTSLEDHPMDPDDPSAAGDAIDLALSRPLGETDGVSLPGVVKGLRSFVRTEPPDASLVQRQDGIAVPADDLRRDGGLADWLSEAGAASSLRPLLSKQMRVVMRSIFITVGGDQRSYER